MRRLLQCWCHTKSRVERCYSIICWWGCISYVASIPPEKALSWTGVTKFWLLRPSSNILWKYFSDIYIPYINILSCNDKGTFISLTLYIFLCECSSFSSRLVFSRQLWKYIFQVQSWHTHRQISLQISPQLCQTFNRIFRNWNQTLHPAKT